MIGSDSFIMESNNYCWWRYLYQIKQSLYDCKRKCWPLKESYLWTTRYLASI